jgi:hypothetical protein
MGARFNIRIHCCPVKKILTKKDSYSTTIIRTLFTLSPVSEK